MSSAKKQIEAYRNAHGPSIGSSPSSKMLRNAEATAIGFKGSFNSLSEPAPRVAVGTVGGRMEQSFAGWGGRFKNAHLQMEGAGYLKPRSLAKRSIPISTHSGQVFGMISRGRSIIDLSRKTGGSTGALQKIMKLNKLF